jgi:dolichol-phosphate mannosyltransferase
VAEVDVSIILPCMNEEEGIPGLKARLSPVIAELGGKTEVLLVDDGSTDGTLAGLERLARELPGARVLRHETNQGLGAAVRTGVAEARGQIVVTTDFDGTYGFEEIPALVAKLREGFDVVVASPYHPDGGIEGVPAYRLVLSKGASTLYRVLVSPRIHTYTSLFRAYRREALSGLTWESNGYLSMAEILVKAIRRGSRVGEYPTVLRTRTFGESKAKTARILRQHLGFLAAIVGSRIGMNSLYFPKK